MAVMMVFTMMPGMAWATETSSNESSEGNIVSGTCGAASNENGAASVTWKLSKDGTLTISGTGAMENYWGVLWGAEDDESLGKKNLTKIKSLVVEEGVTSVGRLCLLKSCSTLESVELPKSLTTIVSGAFVNCTGLKKMKLQYVVTEDNMPKDNKNGCIYGCTAIETIQIENEASTVKCVDGIYYSKDGKRTDLLP